MSRTDVVVSLIVDKRELLRLPVVVALDVDRLHRAIVSCRGPWPDAWTTDDLASAVAKAYAEDSTASLEDGQE